MTKHQPSVAQLTGCSQSHLTALTEGNILLHSEVIAPVRELQRLAAAEGISLAIASGFRSFERQLAIWNAKASGARPVLDSQGIALDISGLDERALMFAILRWSALPGASRHHWGTDMDVWDSAAVADNYPLQLVPEEYAPDGPFARLGQWLASPIPAGLGFVRPYQMDFGGVAPEPWHLSFAPVADRFAECFSQHCLAECIASADILLKDAILANLDDIYRRFVICPR